MARALTRESLGLRFNEGSRLLWARLDERGWTQAEAEKRLGVSAGAVSRWLYGDRRPGLALAVQLRDLLEIPTDSWHEPPTKPFEPPAKAALADTNAA